MASVGESLKRVTLGYYNYYAVPGNIDRLNAFAQPLRRLVAAYPEPPQSTVGLVDPRSQR